MRGSAKRPADPIKAAPPVSQEDENVRLAAMYEEDRLRRGSGSTQNRLINPSQRASEGNLLLNQSTRR